MRRLYEKSQLFVFKSDIMSQSEILKKQFKKSEKNQKKQKISESQNHEKWIFEAFGVWKVGKCE
jgi:hypothetical protein